MKLLYYAALTIFVLLRSSRAQVSEAEDLIEELARQGCPFASHFAVVLPQHKLLWCPSWSTGTRAIYKAIARGLGEGQNVVDSLDCIHHECAHSGIKLLNESFWYRREICSQSDDWFSFTFLRNPFDLVWDAFEYKVKPEPCVNDRMCKAQAAIREFNGLTSNAPIQFVHFVRYIGSQKPREMDFYWVPSSWRCRASGPYHFPYSFAGRVERDHMPSVVSRIIDGVGLPHARGAFQKQDLRIKLHELNHSTHEQAVAARATRRGRYRCDECSNPLELRNTVSKIYHNDIVKFYYVNF